MSLLDGDRFYGKFREGAHKVDISDMMRRMVKEELLSLMAPPCSRNGEPIPPTTNSRNWKRLSMPTLPIMSVTR